MEYALSGENCLFMAIDGKKTYTVEDIEKLPDGERGELISGKLYMMASPTFIHQDILGWLNMKIRLYIEESKGSCKVLPAPFAIYVLNDESNYVEPDISVICDRNKLDEKRCHGAPDWVIEIVSPSSKYMDYVRKLGLYQMAGVREYWIVDPVQGSVTVYGMEHEEGPALYSFSNQKKGGIYEDFFLDFGEY